MEYNILDEYDDGAEYDRENHDADAAADVAFYLSIARETGAPILDLACGTGRLTIPLAQAGYATTGIDIAAPMVEHGRIKGVGLSIDLHVGDCRTFQLQQQFALITMTGNSFQAFLTRDDQEAVLARVREHLLPDGTFAFEVRNPYLEAVDIPDEEFWREFTNAAGQKVVIFTTQHYHRLLQVMDYSIIRRWQADGESQERIKHLCMRFYYPQEMAALLHHNGFRIVQHYGNWAKQPPAADSPRMIYVCQLR